MYCSINSSWIWNNTNSCWSDSYYCCNNRITSTFQIFFCCTNFEFYYMSLLLIKLTVYYKEKFDTISIDPTGWFVAKICFSEWILLFELCYGFFLCNCVIPPKQNIYQEHCCFNRDCSTKKIEKFETIIIDSTE